MTKKILIVFFLLCRVCFAGVNEKYSYKDFTWKSLKDVPVEELNNSTIIGSSFTQNIPLKSREFLKEIEVDVFPDGMTGVIFEKCNLDNVKVPDGNTVATSSTHKKLVVQNDNEVWEVDKDLKPTKPIHESKYDKVGLNKDPQNLPLTKMTENIIDKKEKEIEEVTFISR